MKANIKLGRILGVEIGLHLSWFVIALLITLSLTAQFQQQNPGWGEPVIIGLSILTAVFFFAAIILHELAHSVVAKARGLPVKSITLFALGGVAQVEKEASDAKTEFLVAIVGPLTSIAIGAICLAMTWLIGWSPLKPPDQPLPAMLAWLGYINLLLAVFNMIPGFPLDGGRVLRSVIWWLTGDPTRATRIASRTGEAVATGFIVFGILRFFGGAGFGGLWLAFIGWFLLDASRATFAQIGLLEALGGVSVADVMERDFPTIDGDCDLQTLVDKYVIRTGRRCFAVVEGGNIKGLVTLHDVTGIERERWPRTTVHQVMRPFEKLHTTAPDAPIADALEAMAREDVNQLPVASNGRFDGMVSREHIIRLLQARQELQSGRMNPETQSRRSQYVLKGRFKQ
jgi:Zn-dependent protease/predicted transcriptional regulator